MVNRLITLFISDIKSVARVPVLLCTLLSPVFIALFLLYVYPMISSSAMSEDLSLYVRYYSVTAITLIASIPLIYGLLFSFIQIVESHSNGNLGSQMTGREGHLIIRTAVAAFLSFITVLPVIFLTDPVSTEGWLRSIYAAFLLTVMTTFIFLFAVCFARDIKKRKILFLISAIFLITVPSGLLLHHPWNYFIFFSPFYWLSWAWIITSQAESLMYGIISLAIAGTGILIFCRYFQRNSGIH